MRLVLRLQQYATLPTEPFSKLTPNFVLCLAYRKAGKGSIR